MTLMRASLGDGRERTLLADPVANALITLPNNHSYIHKGQHFKVSFSDEMTDTGDKVSIAVGTPGWVPVGNATYDTLYHMVWRAWFSGPVSFGIYEDCTSVSGGTVQTPMNNNRVQTSHNYTTDLSVQHGSLTRTGGTLIMPLSYIGITQGSASVKAEGFGSRDDDEILLKPESLYVFELTNVENVDHYAGIELAWYEYVPEF
jgi:hypothetical protein